MFIFLKHNICKIYFLAPTLSSILNDITFDYITPNRQCFKWSSSAVKWFPTVAQNIVEIETTSNLALIQELQSIVEREYRFLMNGNDEYFVNYKQSTLLISVFKCIFELSNFPPYAYKYSTIFKNRLKFIL